VTDLDHETSLLYNTLEDAFTIGWSLAGVHVTCGLCSHRPPVLEWGPEFGVMMVLVSDMTPRMREHVRAHHSQLRFLDGRG
jgi:hypothetical protein